MKTVIIYGIEHKGCTYNAVQLFKNQLNISENDITEFFLPKDLPHFCIGCNNCFMKGEGFCPHNDYVAPIKDAIYKAELVILASPVYVFHVTGQMKAFLDHFAFQWMAHKPDKSLFSKTALVVAMGANGGMDSAIKDMKFSLTYWGVSRIFSFGYGVFAAKWEDVTEKNKIKIERKIKNISNKIKLNINKHKPSVKMKILFNIFRMVQKKYKFISHDFEYWKRQGWLDKNRPWKDNV
jgi:multimeric flavodoxin WrbA